MKGNALQPQLRDILFSFASLACAIVALVLCSTLSLEAHAGSKARCALRRGKVCTLSFKNVRPTLQALNSMKLEKSVRFIEKLPEKNLKFLTQRKSFPVVKGPQNQLYLVGSHHLAQALWETGFSKIRVKIVADYSPLSPKDFWKLLRQNGFSSRKAMNRSPASAQQSYKRFLWDLPQQNR